MGLGGRGKIDRFGCSVSTPFSTSVFRRTLLTPLVCKDEDGVDDGVETQEEGSGEREVGGNLEERTAVAGQKIGEGLAIAAGAGDDEHLRIDTGIKLEKPERSRRELDSSRPVAGKSSWGGGRAPQIPQNRPFL